MKEFEDMTHAFALRKGVTVYTNHFETSSVHSFIHEPDFLKILYGFPNILRLFCSNNHTYDTVSELFEQVRFGPVIYGIRTLRSEYDSVLFGYEHSVNQTYS